VDWRKHAQTVREMPSAGGRKGKKQSGGWERIAIAAFFVIMAIVTAWLLSTAPKAETATPKASKESSGAPPSDGVGPGVMGAQTGLLDRLLVLLAEVESHKGDDDRVARLAAASKVEAELTKIETSIDSSTAVGKQQAGVVALVRSALKSDRDGVDPNEEWSDEKLLETHGLVTYAQQSYWDEAYTGKKYGESFDWYGAWAEPLSSGRANIGDIVRPYLAKDSRILMLGAGNSNMSALMYKEGYENIVNVDIAESVVAHMKQQYGHMDKMTWQTMDATALTFPDGAFDAVIEKGMFDALFAGTGTKVQKVLQEAKRVLKGGGVGQLFSITYSENRLNELFNKAKKTADGAEEQEQDSVPISCKVAGEIQYSTIKERKDKDGQAKDKDFFIYACSKP